MYDGTDATLFVTGVMLQEAVKVRELLCQKGITAALYSMPSVKPIDKEIIKERAALGKPVFTIEEHSVIGGLGDICMAFPILKSMSPEWTTGSTLLPIRIYKGFPKSFDCFITAFISTGRSVDPVVHSGDIDFKIGKAIQMYDGTDATLFVTGWFHSHCSQSGADADKILFRNSYIQEPALAAMQLPSTGITMKRLKKCCVHLYPNIRENLL